MKSNFFDTHSHLNFLRFTKNVSQVIKKAKSVGVTHMLVPGTDLLTSEKAIELASKYHGVYAAIGIHPHHLFEFITNEKSLQIMKQGLFSLINRPEVIGIGEVGLDYHTYEKTKHEAYKMSKDFITLQKKCLRDQINLAFTYKKTLILHNRTAAQDMLLLLSEWGSTIDKHKIVFHCCEPDRRLLEYAKTHKIYMGVDGDVTYNTKKRDFVKQIPLHLLVFETDSPYLLPEPLRFEKKYPNIPSNLPLIAQFIARLFQKEEAGQVIHQVYINSLHLFSLPEDK